MQISKYRSTWLNISCNFQNMVHLLEMYHATQEGCIFLGTCIMTSKKSWMYMPYTAAKGSLGNFDEIFQAKAYLGKYLKEKCL